MKKLAIHLLRFGGVYIMSLFCYVALFVPVLDHLGWIGVAVGHALILSITWASFGPSWFRPRRGQGATKPRPFPRMANPPPPPPRPV